MQPLPIFRKDCTRSRGYHCANRPAGRLTRGPDGQARLGVTLKTALLLLCVTLASLLALEGLTRLFLDDGMLYELEMWKYAREVKVRDFRPDVGHRHRPNTDAQLMGVHVRTNAYGMSSGDIAEK